MTDVCERCGRPKGEIGDYTAADGDDLHVRCYSHLMSRHEVCAELAITRLSAELATAKGRIDFLRHELADIEMRASDIGALPLLTQLSRIYRVAYDAIVISLRTGYTLYSGQATELMRAARKDRGTFGAWCTTEDFDAAIAAAESEKP